MDRVTGRVTPERYDSLAAGYEKEQSELKEKLQEINSQNDVLEMRDKCVKDFIRQAKDYVEMSELTPKLLRTFIKRIEVYEKPEKNSRTCGNHINIHFTFMHDKAIMIDGTMIEEVKTLVPA